jgi:hypothetical protein
MDLHPPHLACFLVVAAALCSAHASADTGDELEPIHLVVDAPATCTNEREFTRAIAALGGRLRAPLPNERARTVVVTIHAGDDADRAGPRSFGALTLLGPNDEATSRSVSAPRCEEVAASLAFFASIALGAREQQEHAPKPAPPRIEPTSPESRPGLEPSVWPGSRPEPEKTRRRGRMGSGGVAMGVVYGAGADNDSTGAHASFAWRVGRSFRGGIAASLARDERTPFDAFDHFVGRGTSGRVGALFGWGAPWNDSVVGFAGEVGVAGGTEHGTLMSLASSGAGVVSSNGRTYALPGREIERTFMSPYTTAAVVLQLPWRAPLRPMVAIGSAWTPLRSNDFQAITIEGGFVWQAW